MVAIYYCCSCLQVTFVTLQLNILTECLLHYCNCPPTPLHSQHIHGTHPHRHHCTLNTSAVHTHTDTTTLSTHPLHTNPHTHTSLRSQHIHCTHPHIHTHHYTLNTSTTHTDTHSQTDTCTYTRLISAILYLKTIIANNYIHG